MSASLPNRIKACFNAMETSKFTFSFNQKVKGYDINSEGYAYCVLELSGSALSSFSRSIVIM
jgi:hypothetical protein